MQNTDNKFEIGNVVTYLDPLDGSEEQVTVVPCTEKYKRMKWATDIVWISSDDMEPSWASKEEFK